jgi:hypothetical protein
VRHRSIGSGRELVGDRQRRNFVGLKRDLLRQQDITRHQVKIGQETIARAGTPPVVEFLDIHR